MSGQKTASYRLFTSNMPSGRAGSPTPTENRAGNGPALHTPLANGRLDAVWNAEPRSNEMDVTAASKCRLRKRRP